MLKSAEEWIQKYAGIGLTAQVPFDQGQQSSRSLEQVERDKERSSEYAPGNLPPQLNKLFMKNGNP